MRLGRRVAFYPAFRGQKLSTAVYWIWQDDRVVRIHRGYSKNADRCSILSVSLDRKLAPITFSPQPKEDIMHKTVAVILFAIFLSCSYQKTEITLGRGDSATVNEYKFE